MGNEKHFISIGGMRRFMTWIDKALILVQNDYHSIIDGLSSIISTKGPQWDAKYSKPSSGIPKTDLASGVQGSLDKADLADSRLPLVSDAIRALQSQIDSVAAKDSFDDLKASSLFADILAAANIYGALRGNADTATNASYASRDMDGNDIAVALSRLSDAVRSLQAQIDSVASRDYKDELESHLESIERRIAQLEA